MTLQERKEQLEAELEQIGKEGQKYQQALQQLGIKQVKIQGALEEIERQITEKKEPKK